MAGDVSPVAMFTHKLMQIKDSVAQLRFPVLDEYSERKDFLNLSSLGILSCPIIE